MWTPPIIETERLLLRPIALADAPDIFEYASNPRVSRHVPWSTHHSIADSESFITAHVLSNYEKHIPEPWGITVKELDNKIVGTVGCRWLSQSVKSMDLGYILAEPLWGRGITTEAAHATLTWVYSNCGVNRIQARCQQENIASARVMEKLGMKREGVLRASEVKDGQFVDVCYYSILREEWGS